MSMLIKKRATTATQHRINASCETTARESLRHTSLAGSDPATSRYQGRTQDYEVEGGNELSPDKTA